MKISVIHPTRGRAEKALQTHSEWIWRTYDNAYGEGEPEWELEFITSVDCDDKSNYSKFIDTVIKNPNKSAIEAINNAAKVATGDVFIVISDDFCCFPAWDKHLYNALKNKSDFLVKTQDGIQKTLITLPIMDRVYYERFGYIYHPEYRHMFCDQEMTAVGHMLGRVIDLPLHFKHNHYTVGGMPHDNINAKNDSTWQQGEALFNERLKTNFGLSDEQIVKPYSEIAWK